MELIELTLWKQTKAKQVVGRRMKNAAGTPPVCFDIELNGKASSTFTLKEQS